MSDDLTARARKWLQAPYSETLHVGLAGVIRDLVATIAAERQAREQAEQERDRLAAEIERLKTTDPTGYVLSAYDAENEIKLVKQERDRLREALRAVLATASPTARGVWALARAALSPQGGGHR